MQTTPILKNGRAIVEEKRKTEASLMAKGIPEKNRQTPSIGSSHSTDRAL